MTPSALIAAFEAHNWMPGLLMASLLVRTWLTDKSKFPVSLPVNWQPVVIALATGFVNAVASLQAGLPLGAVVASTLAWAGSTGFLDGVVVAMWGDPAKAPWWGRFLVMAFDEFETKGPGGGVTKVTVAVGPGPVAAVAVDPPTPSPTAVTPAETPQAKADAAPAPPVLKAVVFLVGAALTYGGCAPAAALPGPVELSDHWLVQDACVTNAPADTADGFKAAVDACRKGHMIVWCAKWPAAEDCLASTDAGKD